jgi:hypothetical protein
MNVVISGVRCIIQRWNNLIALSENLISLNDANPLQKLPLTMNILIVFS